MTHDTSGRNSPELWLLHSHEGTLGMESVRKRHVSGAQISAGMVPVIFALGGLFRGRGSRCGACERAAHAGSALTPSGSWWAWSRTRAAAVLLAEPTCSLCRVRTATPTVAHATSRVGRESHYPSNLVPMFDDCRHTAQRGRGVGCQRFSGATPATVPVLREKNSGFTRSRPDA